MTYNVFSGTLNLTQSINQPNQCTIVPFITANVITLLHFQHIIRLHLAYMYIGLYSLSRTEYTHTTVMKCFAFC